MVLHIRDPLASDCVGHVHQVRNAITNMIQALVRSAAIERDLACEIVAEGFARALAPDIALLADPGATCDMIADALYDRALDELRAPDAPRERRPAQVAPVLLFAPPAETDTRPCDVA